MSPSLLPLARTLKWIKERRKGGDGCSFGAVAATTVVRWSGAGAVVLEQSHWSPSPHASCACARFVRRICKSGRARSPLPSCSCAPAAFGAGEAVPTFPGLEWGAAGAIQKQPARDRHCRIHAYYLYLVFVHATLEAKHPARTLLAWIAGMGHACRIRLLTLTYWVLSDAHTN